MTDFERFQKEFKKWQQKFGLTGYRVYFEYVPLEGDYADTYFQPSNLVVNVRLNSVARSRHKEDVNRLAKHEAIHLLLAKIETLAKERYTSPNDISEATEELTIRLEGLIGSN